MSDIIDEGGKIKKLEQNVVNKIAAGEIIIQPANALKEMLENSIDAHSTMIDILVRDGGLKLLQITDNGDGIDKNDLPLLCERFATSKLSKFEDLESIATYGFRGEALASISHISRLSVVTKSKTSGSPLAYKSFYVNGKLSGQNFKGNNTDPKPVAGKDGTQIIVEDLFYNIPSRLKSIKSKNEEYNRILDVVGKYAVHTEGVGFSLKKYGEFQHALMTRPNLPIKERIRIVYGVECANEVLNLEIDGNEEIDGESFYDKYGLIKVQGAVTNCNFNYRKRMQSIFFINHRLVTCDPLKRAIQSIYQVFLPKGYQPFVYLSLELKPQILDVNVHPTKREVRFSNEDEIIEHIASEVHAVLTSVDTSRSFKTQILNNKRELEDEGYSVAQQIKKYRQENKMVRIDAAQPKLVELLFQKRSQRLQVPRVIDRVSRNSEFEQEDEEEEQDNGGQKAEMIIEGARLVNVAEEGGAEEGGAEEGGAEEGGSEELELEEEQEDHEEEIDQEEEMGQDEEEEEVEEQKDIAYQEEAEGQYDELDGQVEDVEQDDQLVLDTNHTNTSPEPAGAASIPASNESELLSRFAHKEHCHHHQQHDDPSQIEETTFVDITQETEDKKFDVFDDSFESHGELTYTDNKRVKVSLDSIIELREEAMQAADHKLTEILNKSSYIGLVDATKRLCSFQYDVNLYLCNYSSLLYEFYYQVLLSEFCNYGVIEFSSPISILKVIKEIQDDDEEEQSAKDAVEVLVEMRDMFEEYFNIKIIKDKDDVQILSLPMIAKSINPSLNKIPYLLYKLGTKVDYQDEKKCLRGVMQQLALFYVPEIIDSPNSVEKDKINGFLESVIFPLVKSDFTAPKSLSRDVIQIADLPSLYRIFERC